MTAGAAALILTVDGVGHADASPNLRVGYVDGGRLPVTGAARVTVSGRVAGKSITAITAHFPSAEFHAWSKGATDAVFTMPVDGRHIPFSATVDGARSTVNLPTRTGTYTISSRLDHVLVTVEQA